MLGKDSRSWYMVGKHSTTELHTQPLVEILTPPKNLDKNEKVLLLSAWEAETCIKQQNGQSLERFSSQVRAPQIWSTLFCIYSTVLLADFWNFHDYVFYLK